MSIDFVPDVVRECEQQELGKFKTFYLTAFQMFGQDRLYWGLSFVVGEADRVDVEDLGSEEAARRFVESVKDEDIGLLTRTGNLKEFDSMVEASEVKEILDEYRERDYSIVFETINSEYMSLSDWMDQKYE